MENTQKFECQSVISECPRPLEEQKEKDNWWV